MSEAFNLISQGGGWSITLVGMGAVFASLIILMIFIKVFAAILQAVYREKDTGGEVAETPPGPVESVEAPSFSEVTPEVVVAVAMALAEGGRQEEVAAAVSYTIHNHVSGDAVPLLSPAGTADEENGDGPSPWRMAGRARLMNSRNRQTVRGRRG